MALEAISISKRHPTLAQKWLFQNKSLQIGKGEVVGLQGESGCGKSTLCRILAGMEATDQGDVLLNGISTLKPKQNSFRIIQRQPRVFHPVQLIFQHPESAVNPRWKIEQILNEGWQPDKSLLEELQIEQEWLKRYPSELSGGQLQRICIARALSPKTEFLLADEMTTMLDSITQAQIWQAILSLVEKRKLGLLVVSHDTHLLNRICHRIVYMKAN